MRKLLLLLMCTCLCIVQSWAQNRTITGTVKDEKGGPIHGASVMVKGSSKGTNVSEDGTFSIEITGNNKVLSITSVGYLSQEITVGTKTSISVILMAGRNSLDEIVVTAYGTQKRINITGATAKVGGSQIEDIPLVSADQMLQGKVAGLQSSSNSGQPGANQDIRIRGVSSVAGSSQPLYVIDGVQINSGDLTRNTASANALAGINPNDIEDITVLKDASATSLYGSRGSNGVIVITTKRGKAGKTQFRFDTELGANSVAKVPSAGRPLGSSDWLTLAKEGYVNAGYTPAQANTIAKNYGDSSGINTNWFDLISRNGFQQQYNLSASGGDAKTTFYLSGGFFNQNAAVIGSNLKRYSGTINLRHNVSDKIALSFGFTGAYINQNTPLAGGSFSNPVLDIWFLRPTQNPYNADGTYNINRTGNINFPNIPNPLYIVDNNIYQSRFVQARPNFTFEWNIVKDLKFTSRSAIDYNSIEEFQYWNPNHGDGLTYNGRGYAYYTRYFLYDLVNQLDYQYNIKKDKSFYVQAKLGYEAIASNEYDISTAATNYSTDKLPMLANAAAPATAKSNMGEYTFANVFAAATINYKDKYILTGSFRNDGSSRFGANKKYGTFPSIGASWNISKEDFFGRLIETVNLMKLRASYGATGNSQIGNYTAIATQGSGYNYNSQPGTAFNNVGNANLTWEKTAQLNIGLDMAFLKNRINVNVDYYNRKTTNMLFSVPLSAVAGTSTGTQNYNMGDMYNRGVEFTVNATAIKKKDFTWDINFNIALNKNKVLRLYGGQDVANPNNTALNIREGYDVQTWYAREWAGVDPANGNPLWYTDGAKKGTTTNYDSANRVMYGSASPKYFGGFSNTFSYKGLSLSLDFYYNYGNYIRDAWANYLMDGQYAFTYGRYQANMDRWQKPGDITDVPKYVYGTTNKSNSFSTRFLYKGDYIRLRNIMLNYTLPSSIVSKIGLSMVKVYVRGTNLWTKTYDKNLTIDPEQGALGASNLNILMPKSITCGINIGF